MQSLAASLLVSYRLDAWIKSTGHKECRSPQLCQVTFLAMRFQLASRPTRSALSDYCPSFTKDVPDRMVDSAFVVFSSYLAFSGLSRIIRATAPLTIASTMISGDVWGFSNSCKSCRMKELASGIYRRESPNARHWWPGWHGVQL